MADEQSQRKPIRSFVRRMGRMTPRQKTALSSLWPQYGLSLEQTVMAPGIFDQTDAPLWLEIGFGMGEAFIDCAHAYPAVNLIGVEVHLPGVGKTLDRIVEKQLKNVRLFQADVNDVLNQSIPDHSLARVQIFFPDPWHKKRHHKRRLVSKPFLDLLARKLVPGGLLYLATDWQDYADWMIEHLTAHPAYQNRYPATTFVPVENIDRFHTKFEKRGIKLGHGVWDIMFTTQS